MTTLEALGKYLVAQKIAHKGGSREEMYGGVWFFTTILGVKLPIFPRIGFQNGLPAHDTHHMLNSYATNWVGECETAAWELASGGCGRYFVYWIDRLFFLGIALVSAPMRSWRAWQRGWASETSTDSIPISCSRWIWTRCVATSRASERGPAPLRPGTARTRAMAGAGSAATPLRWKWLRRSNRRLRSRAWRSRSV